MAQERQAKRHPAERGLLSRILGGVARALAWLVAALFLSILLEWAGMLFWWPEQGSLHSRNMLEREISYLNSDFRRSLVTSSPARFARGFADTFYYYLFEWTRVVNFIEWLRQPAPADEGRIQTILRGAYAQVADYVIAAMTITQVFAVRLAVLTLAIPVFILFGIVALVDGLVQRDLRRWCGGRESSFVYHHAKTAIFPALILAWVIYLGMPTSMHPNFVILPFSVLFATAIAIAARSFKKYL
ncbi:MAG: TIGR03747 family integrating conjugative element membrane protein [Gammaproteobacteria bacterium]|nr:TIGR03747 family integrating conjugative element membrane protein [Gammaproteobacteria bacterium]